MKPLPQKSDFRSSFCGFAASRLPAADLQPNADPERSEGHALIEIKIINSTN
ncbi:MAG TPA: hypothetical protein P5134_02130 [Bacteroidales bacterium]|nr:hypothetical protein [Bacteroidales bacterium]HRT13394.1 hypothetical protein [Bacteroidales bacterium]